MGHEVGDALEHAARLEDERREGDLVEIHADSGRKARVRVGRRHGVEQVSEDAPELGD